MNIIACPDCAQSVSFDARHCPHCGARGPARRRRSHQLRRLLAFTLFAAALWFAGWIYQSRQDEMTRSLGGIEMPDVSESQIARIERQAAAQRRRALEEARKPNPILVQLTNDLKRIEFEEQLRRAVRGN